MSVTNIYKKDHSLNREGVLVLLIMIRCVHGVHGYGVHIRRQAQARGNDVHPPPEVERVSPCHVTLCYVMPRNKYY